MTDNNPKNSFADYSPILTFIISFFVFHIFDWQDATYFTFAALVSLITYMIELHFIKEDYVVKKKYIKKTNFYSGILSLLFLVVFVAAFLSWNRTIGITLRTLILLLSVVIYLAIMFRAIRILIEVKIDSEKKK